MAKRNSQYWQERFEQIERSQNQQGLQCYADIERQYRQAQKQLEGQLSAWYQRFASNNNITMQDARKMLTSKELVEFKWDINDYIRYGEENAINGTWMKQLENASTRYHISRLEALKVQTQQSLEVMFGNQLDSIDGAMRNIYTSGYYYTAFEIQKGVGVGWDFATLNEKQISKVINKPWVADGKNFSSRIWENRTKLVNELNTELTRNIILGQDPQKAIDAIARKMKTSKDVAGRLVMTEEAFFASAAQKDCFDELDVERFEVVSTMDNDTCKKCRALDGKNFPMSEHVIGINAPPFHPWCRCCTCPYFDDMDIGERAARGADGKTYYIPANVKYEEWENAFVNGDKSGLQEVALDDTIKVKKEEKAKAEELKAENFPSAFTATKAEAANTQSLIDYVNSLEDADPNVVKLYNSMGKLENFEQYGISFKISHAKDYAIETRSIRSGLVDVKCTIPKLKGNNLAGQVNTTLHEEMHLMDLYGRQDPLKSSNWFSTSRKSLVDCFRDTSNSISDDVADLFKQHNEQYKQVRAAVVQDFNKQISDLTDSYMTGTFQGTYKDYKSQYGKLNIAMQSEIDYQGRNIMGGGIDNLQDIYDALSGGRYRDNKTVLYGHGSAYYGRIESQVHETLANYAALSVTRPDLIDLLRVDKPDLVAELDATIIELLKKVGE